MMSDDVQLSFLAEPPTYNFASKAEHIHHHGHADVEPDEEKVGRKRDIALQRLKDAGDRGLTIYEIAAGEPINNWSGIVSNLVYRDRLAHNPPDKRRMGPAGVKLQVYFYGDGPRAPKGRAVAWRCEACGFYYERKAYFEAHVNDGACPGFGWDEQTHGDGRDDPSS